MLVRHAYRIMGHTNTAEATEGGGENMEHGMRLNRKQDYLP